VFPKAKVQDIMEMFKEMKDIIDQDVYFAEKMHTKDNIYKLKTKSKGLFK
jgi:hypothetical protein